MEAMLGIALRFEDCRMRQSVNPVRQTWQIS